MKEGRSIRDLAIEIKRQQESARDFVVEQSALAMTHTGNASHELALLGDSHQSFSINDWSHRQIAEKMSIPKSYYERMRANAPELIPVNVNTWLESEPSKKRMIRVLDSSCRAFVSDSYRPMRNVDLVGAALPSLDSRGCEIRSCEITDRRLYLKATYPSLRREIARSKQKGDIIEGGVVISNSEVGAGALTVTPLVHRLVCLNGMVVNLANDKQFRRVHLGQRFGLEEGQSYRQILSEEAVSARDKALWLEVRDVVATFLSDAFFDGVVDSIEQSTEKKIDREADKKKVVEITAKKVGLGSRHNEAVFHALIEGGDLSQWGLINAFTNVANDVSTYEDATNLERAGGKIITLPKSQWREINERAAA